jgi:hypothetical protein
MASPNLIAIAGIVFTNIAFMVLVAAWWKIRQRRLELQADVQTKLIERFGSSTELVEFLKSNTGREFVHGVQRGSIGAVHEKIVSGIRKAIILSFVGIGLLTVGALSKEGFFLYLGILFLALGLGYLAAAFVSMRLTRADEVPTDVSPLP